MKRRIAAVTTLAWVLLAVTTGPAAAHGDYRDSSPKPDEVLSEVPGEIVVTLSEPSTKDSGIVAKDPCGNVAEDVSVSNNDIIATVSSEAQPGEWRIKWEAISAVDGHSTTGTFKFSVSGGADCTAEGSTPDPTETDAGEDVDLAAGDDSPPASGEGSSFPVIPAVLGGAGLVALALFGRTLGSR